MANSSNEKSTSVAVAVIGIIGTILNILHFVLASNQGSFTTTQLVQIVMLALSNGAVLLVGSLSKNSKDTFAIPYLFGMVTFVMFAYEYFNYYVEKGTSYTAKFLCAKYIGVAAYYIIGCVVLVIGYMAITGKIKNTKISIAGLAIIGGGFFNGLLSAIPEATYRFLRAEQLKSNGFSFSTSAIYLLKYITPLTFILGLIVLQFAIDKSNEEKRTQKKEA